MGQRYPTVFLAPPWLTSDLPLYPSLPMATSAKMVVSELRVPVVCTNFCVPRGPRFGGAEEWGPSRHAKIDFNFFSARTDHYENIFEAFSLPARTFTKIFSKRFSARTGLDYGEVTLEITGYFIRLKLPV